MATRRPATAGAPARTRTMCLDEAADLQAPQGTPAWARAIRLELARMWHDATTNLQRFRNYLRLFEETRGYQQLDDVYGHPFPSLRTFCTAHPPHGLGYDPTILDAIEAEAREMTLGEKVAEVQALQVHGSNQHTASGIDNIKSSSTQGGPRLATCSPG